MKRLRAICSLRLVNRIRDERIKKMYGWRKRIVGRVEEGVLRWFGHICGMNKDRMVGRVVRSEVKGVGEGDGKSREN